jgi:hypothetical protein
VIPQVSPIRLECSAVLSGITIREASRQIATYRAMVKASLRSSTRCSPTPVNGPAGASAMASSFHAAPGLRARRATARSRLVPPSGVRCDGGAAGHLSRETAPTRCRERLRRLTCPRGPTF